MSTTKGATQAVMRHRAYASRTFASSAAPVTCRHCQRARSSSVAASSVPSTSRFTTCDPWLPPSTSTVGRCALNPKRAACSSREEWPMTSRTGMPVTTDGVPPSARCVSQNDTATRSTHRVSRRFARPIATFCSWSMHRMRRCRAARMTGADTQPPKPTTTSGETASNHRCVCDQSWPHCHRRPKRLRLLSYGIAWTFTSAAVPAFARASASPAVCRRRAYHTVGRAPAFAKAPATCSAGIKWPPLPSATKSTFSWVELFSMTARVEDERAGDEVHDHRGAAVRNERQRQPLRGQEPGHHPDVDHRLKAQHPDESCHQVFAEEIVGCHGQDRKSTRLNSSHSSISYAVFCLKKKKT